MVLRAGGQIWKKPVALPNSTVLALAMLSASSMLLRTVGLNLSEKKWLFSMPPILTW